MPTGSDKDIERLRELSREIDELFVAGKDAQGAELLERTLKEAETLDDAYALFFQGERCGYIDKDFETQEPLFRRALELRPDDFFLLRNMGICLSNLSRFDEALVMYDKALEIKPEDYDSWRNKGVSLSEFGREDEALEMYAKALELHPEDYHSLEQKGVALSKLGRDHEALGLFDQALALNPKDHRAMRNKGVSLAKLGLLKEALALFDAALELNPKDHYSLREKAVTQSKLGRVEEALVLFDAALALNPNDHSTLCKKGVSLSKLGRDDEALALFDSALALNPNDHNSLRDKGASLSNLGRDEEALNLYGAALALNPKDYHALRNKGVSHFKLGHAEEALALFDSALALNPKDHHALRQKAISLAELGRAEEALVLLDAALALEPKDFAALREKGASLTKLGRVGEALPLFDAALALNPKDYLALCNKGTSLANLGRFGEALDLFNQSLKIRPDDRYAQAGKSFVLSKTGHFSEAMELIRKVADENPKFEYAQRVLRYLSKLGAMEQQASGEATPQTELLPESTSRKPEELTADAPEIGAVVEHVRKVMGGEIDRFKESMEQTRERLDAFLLPESRLDPGRVLFFVLRKWNSYTPSIPRNTEDRGVGGGYFIWNKGQGTVIDPGYNFIENFEAAGFRVADIHNIILTHAHNDHTIDFESILTLLYKYNEPDNLEKHDAAKKAVKLYLNAGSHKKFSGLLDLRGAEYLDFAYTLMPGHAYDFGNGMTLQALPAYHDEVIGTKYSVGLHFSFEHGGGPAKHIVMTSDTGLFPQKKGKDGAIVADHAGVEIWKRYDLMDQRVDPPEDLVINLLVPHLGSVRAKEFEADVNSRLSEVDHPNHLGVIGTVRVISALRPKLAVVSEFGEELRDFQENLIEMLETMVHGLCGGEAPAPNILPGDLSFVYDVMKEEIYCPISKTFYDVGKVSWSYPNEKEFSFYYKYGAEEDASKLESASKDFLKRRRNGDAIYFKSQVA